MSTQPNRNHGHIVAVVGGKGGIGKSVFAANFAVAMAADTKSGPAIIDFDPMGTGDLSLILGIKQGMAFGDAILDAKVKDANEVKKLFKVLPAGGPQGPLHALQFCSNPERLFTEDDDKVDAALKLIRRCFPVTIVDCGSRLEGGVLKVLDLASLIVVVTNPDVLVLNQTKKIIDKLQVLLYPPEMTRIVVNRFPTGSPYTPQFIESALKRKVLGLVPDDVPAATAALAKGAPYVLLAPQSSATKSLFSLSRLLVEKRVLDQLAALNKPQRPKPVATPASSEGDASNIIPMNQAKAGKNGREPSDARSLFKLRVHAQLVEKMDLKAEQMERNMSEQRKIELRTKATKILSEIMSQEDHQWKDRSATQSIIKEVLDETFGLGPLEDLLKDVTVTEIMVNRADRIYIEKSGKNLLSPVTFSSNGQLRTVIERIVSPMGRVINESMPYVDARLPDGSRVHAIIPPLSIDGPMVTIRKFPTKRLGPEDLVKFGTLTQEMCDFLRACIEARLNVVVSGGTGSGKTTLLNVLSSFIPSRERILTVEDAAELQLIQDHVGRLEARPAGIEGNNAVTIRDLVKQTLRMKPDRIIIGEVRAGEALDMLQAMNTGHDGSMATVHANNPRDALTRIETLVMMAGMDLPVKAIRDQVSSAVNLIVQQSRLSDGSRRITYITEVCGMQGDVITTQNIFEYHSEGIDKDRKVIGKHVPTGFMPKAMERFEALGIRLPKGIFKAA